MGLNHIVESSSCGVSCEPKGANNVPKWEGGHGRGVIWTSLFARDMPSAVPCPGPPCAPGALKYGASIGLHSLLRTRELPKYCPLRTCLGEIT